MASGKKSFEKLINEKQKNEQKIIAEDRKKHPELYDRKSLISQAKKRSEEKVDLITSDGKNLGKISRMGLYSLNNGKAYTPKDNTEIKTIENYREYASSLEKEKRINSNPTTKKYGIDPDNFTKADFEKWAEKHGFEYRMSGNDLTGAEMKWLPKQKGGWKFWEVVPSKEEQADKKTLEILAENNTRKAASQTDRGAVSAAITGTIDGLTFGGVSAYADWDAKRNYKKAGFDEERFVSYKQANAKTESEHKIAGAAGNIAGSIVSLGGLSKAVGAATSGVKWIAKAPGWIQSAINNGITFAVQSGAETAFDGGNFEDVLKSAGINLVGGAVGGGISNKVGSIGEKLLFDKGLQHKVIPEMVRTGISSAAFAGSKTASTYFLYPKDYRPTKEEMAKDIATAFAFGAISSGINTIKTSSQNKKYLDSLYQKMAADYESMAKANISGKNDTSGIQKFAKNVVGYSNAMEAYLTGKEYNATINGEIYTFAPNKIRLVGQDKYVKSILSEINTIRNNANAMLNGIGTPTTEITVTSNPTNSANVSAATVFTDKNTAISENAPVQPSDTIVATSVGGAAITPQGTPTVVASKPDTAIKTNTDGELGEIMDSEPIVTFTPKTASSEVKRLENILIAKGADDTSRKEIIDTAVEIEKNLGNSDKNIRSVFDDVSKITSTAVSEIQSQAGLSNAYWKLFGENFKNVMAGTAKENINLVTEYSNAYAKALKNNNPEKYNSVMLSSDGNDLSGELPKTVMQNIIPNNAPNAEKYKLIATRIKNIINTADVQLESERNKIYGEKNTAAIENDAESTKIQTVAGHKNITLTRVGDFYETFGDEAVELANKLNLTLTTKSINGERVQMVGFPVSSLERYAQALGNGYNISVSDTPSVTNQMTQNTPARTENATVNEDATDADIINHAKEVDGLKLVDTEESTLINGKTLITGVYELNSDKDFGRKAYKKEKIDYFRKSGNPWTETANGTTYGHYGFYKYKDGQYLVIHLPTGMGITDVKTESKAKSLIKAFDDNLPELPISIKAFGDEYRCDGITQETSELIKNIINSDDENTSEIKLPLKNKKELITYLKKHKGDKIGVSYNQGAEDVRTIVSASDTVIVTERADGQRGELRAKANELSYAEDGFVYTGSNGATVSYRFIEENTSSEKAPESKSDIENSESVTENTDSVTGIKYDHLYDEEKVSKAYLNSVNPEIENAVISIRNGDIDSVPDVINVTDLDEKTIKAISELVGFDVSGYACRIEKDAIMHIENRHGINGNHDHSLSDPKDTARMGYVINNSDSVSWIKESDGSVKTSKKYKDKNNKYAKLVMMQKKIDGTYCVSDVVPDSKNKTVWITSARIQKKHQDLNDTQVSPKTTSDNALNASNNNISQDDNAVNIHSTQNGEKYSDKNENIKRSYNDETSSRWTTERIEGSKDKGFAISGYKNYTYDVLTKKNDMPVTMLDAESVRNENGIIDRKSIVEKGIENVRAKDNAKNTDSNSYVYVKDIERDILITKDGLRHGLSRNAFATAFVTTKIGDVLENSIRVNELKARGKTAGGYVLLGVAADKKGNVFPVRVVVNNFAVDDVEVLSVLYAVNAKRRTSLRTEQGVAENSAPLIKGSSIMSVAELLELVKNDFSDVLTDDVLNNLSVKRKNSSLSESIKYLKYIPIDDSANRWTTERIEGSKDSGKSILSKKNTDDIAIAVKNTIQQDVLSNTELMNMLQQRFGNNTIEAIASEIISTFEKTGSIGKFKTLFTDKGQSVSNALKNRSVTSDKFSMSHNDIDKVSKNKLLKEDENGEGRNHLLLGNRERRTDESSRKQVKRVSSYKQKLEGKSQSERKETAKKLTEKGYTEEVISGNHRYSLIKDAGYNDDMRSIVSEAKAYGKQVGFFVGNATRKFDGQRNFKIDGIKVSDTKILIRYDGAYSPQALLMHELVHTEWDNPEMKKARDIILSDLSENDKEKILQSGRYKAYMDLYNGNVESVWEEFIADVFADMSNYSDDYIDTAVDYWYNDKVIDRYNPSEYIKSMDSGGNEKVLDKTGFGNNYSLSYNDFNIPYNEKRQLDDYILRKNHSSKRIKKIDCKEIGNNFYVWENNNKIDYVVICMTEIDGNEDLINNMREVIKNGTYRFTNQFNFVYEGRSGNGRGCDNSLNAADQRRRSANGDGRIFYEQSKSNAGRRSGKSGADKKFKYALTSSDDNTEFWQEWFEKANEYGIIPKGEKPTRNIDVPKQINDKDVVSQFARTMLEAGVTPQWSVSEFEKAILEGNMTHEIIDNKNAQKWAKDQIKYYGFEESLKKWSILSESGKIGKKEMALGMELYNQCITNKDAHNAMKIAAELASEATRAGQTLQACRMLKLMTPDGQLYYLEKSIQKMNDEFREKIGNKYKDIKLDEKLINDFLNEQDESKRDAIYDNICQNIADQIPATLLDKWNSWRYLAMLGNLKTHIRNIVGNAVFIPAVRIKNYIGAAIERAVRIKPENRTHSAYKNKEAIEFAKKDFDVMKKVLQGENAKYAVTSDVEGKRTIFKTKWLEKLRLKNFEFLEKEDMWFLKMHYIDALARLISVRNIDTTSIAPKTLETLRAYAVKEAQVATYRNANSVASGLNKLQRKLARSDKKTAKAASILLEGVMPFKGVPLNVVNQGVNYSPI